MTEIFLRKVDPRSQDQLFIPYFFNPRSQTFQNINLTINYHPLETNYSIQPIPNKRNHRYIYIYVLQDPLPTPHPAERAQQLRIPSLSVHQSTLLIRNRFDPGIEQATIGAKRLEASLVPGSSSGFSITRSSQNPLITKSTIPIVVARIHRSSASGSPLRLQHVTSVVRDYRLEPKSENNAAACLPPPPCLPPPGPRFSSTITSSKGGGFSPDG